MRTLLFRFTLPGLFLFLLTASNLQSQAFSEETLIKLTAAGYSASAWGDYDNDGDLDIVIAGDNATKIYEHIYQTDYDTNFAELVTVTLPTVYDGSVDWGDFDNDGYIDLLLSGSGATEVYRNNSGIAFDEQPGIVLPDAYEGCAVWGDLDNDGFLDIVSTGDDGYGNHFTRIFLNNHDNTFTEQSDISITGIKGSVSLGDYDNDKDLDILISGYNGYWGYLTRIYRNDNGTFTDIDADLPPVGYGSTAWGDYDNDGDLDILISGYGWNDGRISRVYRNDAGIFTDIVAGLTGVEYGTANWGDYDNDGDLDILLTGEDASYVYITKVYRNDAGSFSDISESLTGVLRGSGVWGDYDKDGDLDILLTGNSTSGYVSKVYVNNSATANTVPVAPTGLVATPVGNKVTLSWNKSTDTETAQNGLSYNVYVGTSTGTINKRSPMSSLPDGFRRVARKGLLKSNSWQINRLPAGTYYWSVQATDNALAGSPFASEGNFTVPFSNSIAPIAEQVVLPAQNFTTLTVTESTTPTSREWKYSTVSGGPYDQSISGATGTTCASSFPDEGIYYVVCVSVYGGVSYTSNQVKVVVTNFIEQTDISLTGVYGSSASWGDYDNDGDMDLLLAGDSNSGRVSLIYRNDGSNTFVDQAISLTPVRYSSSEWGDYDGDGDLDILITGDSDGGYVSKIYRNNGDNTFTEQTTITLQGVYSGSVAWDDYDNDGDLDILLTGDTDSEEVSLIYRNDSGVFTDIGAGLTGARMSSVDWGDYDNDGDLDILLAGYNSSIYGFSRIYRNDNGAFTATDPGFYNNPDASVAWGDYDNDGDLDVLWSTIYNLQIYNNDGGDFTRINLNQPDFYSGDVAWGDYDNDGDLDFLVTGIDREGFSFNKIFRNDDNVFTEVFIHLDKVDQGSIDWVDYDNDGDLDIMLTGNSDDGPISKIYKNSITSSNTVPATPTGLSSANNGNTVTLSWNKTTDTQTPQDGLSYNLYIGTASGIVNKKPPMSALPGGERRIVHRGPVQGNTWPAKRFLAGTYYWSVQAIDHSFAGSAFATEGTFTVPFSNSIAPETAQILQLNQDGTPLTVTESSTPDSRQWMYSTVSGGPYDQAIAGATGTAYTPNFGQFGKYYVVCISVKDAVSYISNEVKISVPAFTETGIALEGVYRSGVDWGDFDNDGDLDILMTGYSADTYTAMSEIFMNDGAVEFDNYAVLTGLYYSSAAWGDYDNDGDLDILITGYDGGSEYFSLIYNNNAGVFTDIGAGLTGVYTGSGDWADYDNDGDLDVLITGQSISEGDISKIYRNDAGIFTDIEAGLYGVGNGSAAWGDFDNDGDQDIVLSGSGTTKLYRNDNGNFIDTDAGLYGQYSSAVAWGDYDSDGDLDILLAGSNSSMIYDNEAGVFTDIAAGLPIIQNGSVAWGDFDNDGDLDILMAGEDPSSGPSSIIFRNDDGVFVNINEVIEGVSNSDAAWGDYDNDGDLDILLTGSGSGGRISKIYSNIMPTANNIPAAPSNMQATPGSNIVTFSWDNAADTETSQNGLSYNLYVGTTTGSVDRLSPMADVLTGYRRIVQRGIQTNSWTIKRLPAGSYYWSIQTIDNNFAGSAFAPEGIFTVAFSNSIAPIEDQSLQLSEDGDMLTVTESSTPDSRQWMYSTVSGGPYDQAIAGATGETYTPNFSDYGTYYVVCVSVKDAVTYTTNEVKINVPAFTEQTDIVIDAVYNSSASWGDYDNDGDLDILITGSSNSGYISKIYMNDLGVYTDISAGLTPVRYGATAWGDYDNDGDLDILLTGYDGSDYISKIYNNDAGVFTDIDAGLTGVYYSSVAWGDYDNDGDLDIILAGYTGSSDISKIYRNDAGVFSDIDAGLAGIEDGDVTWGDYDNDGDLDILLTGSYYSLIYRNDNGIFTDIEAGLPNAYNGTVAWGDYDSDGDLDILLTTYSPDYGDISRIYNNDAGVFTDIEAGLEGIENGSAVWADFDNDGDLDIILCGYNDIVSARITRFYLNDTGAFTDITDELKGYSMTPVNSSAMAVGDYDNDGDLDILLTGYGSSGRLSKVYTNNTSPANDVPVAPSNLQAAPGSNVVTLSWNKTTDTETPQNGLSYNLYIGTTTGSGDMRSPMADVTSGYRRIVHRGIQTNSWTINRLPAASYYWSVQAIDNNFAGSAFASEGVFTVAFSNSIAPEADQTLGLNQNGVMLTVTESSTPDSRQWMYSTVSGGPYDVAIPGATAATYTPNFSDFGTYYVVCVSTKAAVAYISNQVKISVLPFEEQTGIALEGVEQGSVSWGDYDNDGDLDILLTGRSNAGYISRIYRNDAGVFTDIVAGLQGVYRSSVAWGDYDNDNDLDILLTGYDGSEYISRIYRNDAGLFTDIAAGLTGVRYSSVAWGDYDNDGDLDILLTGSDGSNNVSKIYRYDAGVFTDIAAGLTGVQRSSVDWGDYDNDGDLDILLTGDGYSKVYRNDNGVFTDIVADLYGISNGSASWGDYDNDGDLDILLAGNSISRIYNNDAGVFTDISAGLQNIWDSSADWGDFDNDGDLDILLTGWDGSARFAKVYRNDAGVFTGIEASITDVTNSSVAWGDYDNDGDLDFLLTGYGASGYTAKVFRNNTGTANTVPAAPANLLATPGSNIVTLAWDKSTDTETPQDGLSYNLYIGTTAGTVNRLSPMADITDGYKRIVQRGIQTNSWIIKRLIAGTYYWSVQAIDNGFAGSPFATEGSFTVAFSNSISPTADQTLQLNQDGTMLVVSESSAPTSRQWMYSTESGGPYDQTITGAAGSSYTPNFSSFGTYYVVCVSVKDAISYTTNEVKISVPAFEEQTGIILEGVDNGSMEWGDYDNDGDLDILLTGYTGSVYFSEIYRNDAGVFTDIDAGLTGVYRSSVAWGDYDNDGDLDILLSGYYWDAADYYITKIYRNDAGNFTDIAAGLTGVYQSSVAWGDYDNDGDLDLLLTGDTGPNNVSKIYRNDSGVFTDINAGLTGVNRSSVDWGDYDNDGDLDILLTGSWDSYIYRNDNGKFTDIDAGLYGIAYGSASWGDYDSDGDLDILLTGNNTALIYNNVGGVFTDIEAGLTGISNSTAAWCDFDNDGDLDIISNGYSDPDWLTAFYRNDAGTFTDVTDDLALYSTSELLDFEIAVGDYDNDGDLDGLLAGESSEGPVSRIFRNNTTPANVAPTVPSGLTATPGSNVVSLTWTKSTDTQTPQDGLSYNLYIGSTAGTADMKAPMSDITNGYRRIVRRGIQTDSCAIKMLPAGTYYWSVQSIDNNFAGSAFATEKSFTVAFSNSIAPIEDQTLQLNEDGDMLTVTEPDTPDSRQWWYSTTSGGPYDQEITGATLTTYTPNFSSFGTYYVVCISTKDAVEYISNEVKISVPAFTEQTGIVLEGVEGSSVAWGDYDNDGDLDILLTGYNGSYISEIYTNDAGIFTAIGAGLPGVQSSSVDWGDYDNDGDLDILLSGYYWDAGNHFITKIYQNDAGVFTDIDAGLTDLSDGSAKWGDYDNDGDLDILSSGYDGTNYYSRIYRNDAGVFTDIDAGLAGGERSSVDWGDYDNDGDLDILLTGSWNSRVYRNDNGVFSDISAGLYGIYYGSALWGDYDNDGDLDILLTGAGISRIYNNDAGVFTDISAGLQGVYDSGASAWADYDNDGDLDILITGNDGSDYIARIYSNDAGIFTGFDAGLTGVNSSSVAWGDYDNDGDLDILLAGLSTTDRVAKVYRNNSPAANTIPAAPANLVATPGANFVSLTWDKATDTETAQDGLSYNLYVGSSAGSIDRKSPMADLTNGYRRVVGKGSVQTDTTTIKMLPAGTYYWSVQAVDNAFAGSAFAAEGTFTIDFSNSVSPVADQELLIDQNGTVLTVTESSTPDSRQWKYSTVSGGPYDQEITGEGSTTYTPNFQAFGAYYVVCVSVKDGVEYISNEVKINIAAFTEQTGITLTGLTSSCSVSWGDYDSDGDLDILLVGRTNTGYISTIYNNDGGVFTDTGAGTDQVYTAALGDYDNDGDLDVLITGYESPDYYSRVYRNDAGDFVDIDAGLTGVYNSAMAWGDYDNDGDLDILITGRDDTEYYSKIYSNDAGTFTDIDAGLTPVRGGSVEWGDYDNDGDKDILLTGYTGSNTISEIYRNDDGVFTDIDAGFSGGYFAIWGDYDNDGDLDVLSENRIYANNGDGTFTHQSDINLLVSYDISSAWGDYDNDGDLDILISGYSNTGGGRITCIYRNEGNNTFELLTGVSFKGTQDGSVAWGDYDNDGDLDIIIAGNYATTVYRNNSIVANTSPAAPSNLVAAGVDANTVSLSWNKATDTNTPQNTLTYNVRMGTVAGGSGIVGPMASGTNGYRRIPARGNADLVNDGYFVTDLDPGRYYWSVQAVDQAYAGGAWATESQFYILEAPVANAATNITETSFTANWAASAGATGYIIDVATDSTFTTMVAGYDNLDAGDVTSTSITGLTSGTTYYYRLRAYDAVGTSVLNSNRIKVTTLGVPAAPEALDATGISQTVFTANWNSMINVEGYLLDVSTDDTFSSFVTGYNNADVGNVTSVEVTGLTASTVYYYRVRAYNSYGTGENSNTITVTTLVNPPPAPGGFTAHSCNDLVTLTWNAVSATYFSHYLIYGGESANPTTQIDSIADISTVTITLTGLTHGATYFYRMVAVNALGMTSPYSSEVSVTVKTGVIPRIKAKWGDVLICYNIGDSLTQFSWYKGSTQITGETKQYYVTNKDPGSYHVETTDIDGCINSSNVIDISGAKSLSVYPNPAKSVFTMDLYSDAVGEAVVSLYNSTGMKALEYRTEKKETWLNCEIPLGNLNDGIYMIEVIVNNEEINYTRLIVIE